VLPHEVPTVEVDQIPSAALVLDVREDDEWAAGHIDGAHHVPMGRVPQQLQFDPGPIQPDVPLVVVCKVGGRSAQVTAWLNRQGYDAVNLAGGMLAWEGAGRPMVAEHGGPAAVV
jgi:rhodanese-related sulfurtransferase